MNFLGQRSCVAKNEILQSQQSRSKNPFQVSYVIVLAVKKKKKMCRWEHLKSLCIGYAWENESQKYWLNAYKCCFWVSRVNKWVKHDVRNNTYWKKCYLKQSVSPTWQELAYWNWFPGSAWARERNMITSITQFSWVSIFTESPIYR